MFASLTNMFLGPQIGANTLANVLGVRKPFEEAPESAPYAHKAMHNAQYVTCATFFVEGFET